MTACDTRCGRPACCMVTVGAVLVIDDGVTVGYGGARLVRVHRGLALGCWLPRHLAERIYPGAAYRWIRVNGG